jgi:hypothetical protein
MGPLKLLNKALQNDVRSTLFVDTKQLTNTTSYLHQPPPFHGNLLRSEINQIQGTSIIARNNIPLLRYYSQFPLSTISSRESNRDDDLVNPSSCSSIYHIPHKNNTVRRNNHLVQETAGVKILRNVISPRISTRRISSPRTRNSNGMRKKHSVNSRGRSNGVRDAGAIGRNGAMPVPGSRNLVNFSILFNSRPRHSTKQLANSRRIGDEIEPSRLNRNADLIARDRQKIK